MRGNDYARLLFTATARIVTGPPQFNSLAAGDARSQIEPAIFPAKGATDMNIFFGNPRGTRLMRRTGRC